MMPTVVLAPVPCIHLRSALSIPALAARVAFGSSQQGVLDLPVGARVFIYVSDAPEATAEERRLLMPGRASWTGRLGAVVRAVEHGRRTGKHPDAAVRPPSAEEADKAFLFFWEVIRIHRLVPSRPLSHFKSTLPVGNAPPWPIVAE